MSGLEGYFLFDDYNTVVYWYCSSSLENYCLEKFKERGFCGDDFSTNITQLFGSLINLEAQYDTSQNSVDFIHCENGFAVKLRHLGVYSLLVIGDSDEDSHLLYMADMFRAVSQLFVGYSYGSLQNKYSASHHIGSILRSNSIVSNDLFYRFLRACELVPRNFGNTSSKVKIQLEDLVTSSSSASILDDYGIVLEAHYFVSDLLVGSARISPHQTKQRILPSELWKLRDMAKVVAASQSTEEKCSTLNVFLNSCEPPYFLACRAHILSSNPKSICILLSEHNWSSIARPMRRLLKLLSMILRGQPSVSRLTARHLDTIASTELNRMSDCIDEFTKQEATISQSSDETVTSSVGSSMSSTTTLHSASKMLPQLGTVRSIMHKALDQFRTIREKEVFVMFSRNPRNTAHHSPVKKLYEHIEHLHTVMFQPLKIFPSPEIFANRMQESCSILSTLVPISCELGASLQLPPHYLTDLDKLVICILVDRSSNTFACLPNLRKKEDDTIDCLGVQFPYKNLMKHMEKAMWRCWPLIKSGHTGASWISDFKCFDSDGNPVTTAFRFAYACNAVDSPALKSPSKNQPYANMIAVSDFSQFERVFNDPDVTSQLVWNEHFYRLLARIYSESSVSSQEVAGVKSGRNVFSLDFNASSRSRQGSDSRGRLKSVTVVYEAFCLFMEPVSSQSVDKILKSLFTEGVETFADCERFFPLNSSQISTEM